jgi:hypothetical protein
MNIEPKEVSPRKVLAQIAAALPSEVHPNIIIIGSLAAAYWLSHGDETFGVRTKDVDCVLSPHFVAVEAGRAVVEKLLANGWRPAAHGEFGKPGNAQTADDKLPAVGLYPPESNEWFTELLTEPATENQTTREWTRLPFLAALLVGPPGLEPGTYRL